MPLLSAAASALVMVDFQARLMPAMDEGARALENGRRLVRAARLLGVPVLFTEQNPERLGATMPELETEGHAVLAKMSFDGTTAPGFDAGLPADATVLVAGWEAHVCVLQTALSLREQGREVAVVEDAVSSRRPESRTAALRRMEAHGVEPVTTEMVVFEWLGSAEHPRFREAVALVK